MMRRVEDEMKKILFLILLFSTVVLAKTELKDGNYSWFRGGGQAYLSVNKQSDGRYHIEGECLYGVGRKGGPNIGDLAFTAPLKNGKIVYVSDEEYIDYTFILSVNNDGSFDVDEKGEDTPFGHRATFYGHFTSDDLPSFSCKKASSFIEHTVCDNLQIARLDRKMARAYEMYWSAFFYDKRRESLEKTLKKEQRAWIKKRNKCEDEKNYKSCLITSYKKRIKELDKQFNHFWGYCCVWTYSRNLGKNSKKNALNGMEMKAIYPIYDAVVCMLGGGCSYYLHTTTMAEYLFDTNVLKFGEM